VPSVSESQRKPFGMALAMKRGEMPHSKSDAAYQMMRSMSTEELRKMASKPMMKKKMMK